jgi:hypothetical protein
MGPNAHSIGAHRLGRSLLRFVALVALMLASSPNAAWQYQSPALEPQGRFRICPATSKDQSDFSGLRVKSREMLFHPASRSAKQLAAQSGAESQAVPKTFLDMTPAELSKAVPELKHLKSPTSKDSLPLILERVGATVADFFENFSNTTCTEHIISAVDTPLKSVAHHYDLKSNYVALAERGSDKTLLRESRTDSKGEPIQPRGAIVTTGFVALLAHFHPAYQSDSQFRYLGRELVKGQSSCVIAFAQRPGVARKVGRVTFDGKAGIVLAQGVAWVDPVTFRILRLRTDIEQPDLHVGLQNETTEVEYSEVTFKEGGKTLWLPREVTVRGQLNKYRFLNHHAYSDYRLFVVSTEEKPKNP